MGGDILAECGGVVAAQQPQVVLHAVVISLKLHVKGVYLELLLPRLLEYDECHGKEHEDGHDGSIQLPSY